MRETPKITIKISGNCSASKNEIATAVAAEMIRFGFGEVINKSYSSKQGYDGFIKDERVEILIED
jgi:hypothetical protein